MTQNPLRFPIPCCLLIALAVVLAPAAVAAVLDPPCIEVPAPVWFPHDFVEPGHYCLIEDVEADMDDGIAFRILSPGVTFDLGGFEIRNVAADPGDSYGVTLAGERSEITNGAIVGFGVGLAAGCHWDEAGQRVTRLHIDRSRTHGAILYCRGTLFEGNLVTSTGDGSDWARAVNFIGQYGRAVDNDIFDVEGQYGTALSFSGKHGIAIGNRMSRSHNGIITAVNARCRDNLAADVLQPYLCDDLGNND